LPEQQLQDVAIKDGLTVSERRTGSSHHSGSHKTERIDAVANQRAGPQPREHPRVYHPTQNEKGAQPDLESQATRL